MLQTRAMRCPANLAATARLGSAQSLCILAVGVETRRVPDPKSASTATVPLTEMIRPSPWRSWATRSPTLNTSSGGIASRAALKGLAGSRRLGAGEAMRSLSSSRTPNEDNDLPTLTSGARIQRGSETRNGLPFGRGLRAVREMRCGVYPLGDAEARHRFDPMSTDWSSTLANPSGTCRFMTAR